MHIENSGLDLSRALSFDTDQLYVFITEGLPLTPQSPILGAGRREQIHETMYIIYAINPAKPLPIGKTALLNFKVAPVTSAGRNAGLSLSQPANAKMIALIAFAAACASGFLVAGNLHGALQRGANRQAGRTSNRSRCELAEQTRFR